MAFILYDVETSGLNKRFDQILQFAAVRTDADLVETHRIRDAVAADAARRARRPRRCTSLAYHARRCEQHVETIALFDGVRDRERARGLVSSDFLGFNSIRFDEEFLRQAFYQCLHPVFLTNTNGNAQGRCPQSDAGGATLHPSVIRPGVEIDGRLSYRLGALAAANGIAQGKAHDATRGRRRDARAVPARPGRSARALVGLPPLLVEGGGRRPRARRGCVRLFRFLWQSARNAFPDEDRRQSERRQRPLLSRPRHATSTNYANSTTPRWRNG